MSASTWLSSGSLRLGRLLKWLLALTTEPHAHVLRDTEVMPVVDITPELLPQGVIYFQGTAVVNTNVNLVQLTSSPLSPALADDEAFFIEAACLAEDNLGTHELGDMTWHGLTLYDGAAGNTFVVVQDNGALFTGGKNLSNELRGVVLRKGMYFVIDVEAVGTTTNATLHLIGKRVKC